MRLDLLTPADEALLRDERSVLSRLGDALERVDAAPASRRALDDAITQLDGLFLLVVVGEFNSGKSAFINALIGETVLEEGVTPTTAQVHVLQYGTERARVPQSSTLHVVSAPVPLLRDLHIVDTPGTNAVIREHETITTEFVPRADLVLFVTSADRPFTETERQFLSDIRDWGKKLVFVVNKIDVFEREADLNEVMRFVTDQARQLTGSAAVDVFPVSARLALRAKQGQPALWASSRFEALEHFIVDRLDERERLRLKLSNPIGVGLTLANRYRDLVAGRLDTLKDDLAVLDDVDRQLGVYRQDMDTQFEHRMRSIEHTLLEMEARGHAYFDEMLRLGRVFDMFNKARVQQGFEREVVADTPARIERHVTELVDWMVSADLRQWQAVTSHLADRRRQYEGRIVGEPENAAFELERGRLLDAVGGQAQRVVDSYDRERESAALAEHARNAVAATAAVGVGAVGLGAAVTALASTAAADVTGILMASLVATLGLFIIPGRRKKAKTELRAKVTAMRESLGRSLREQFKLEMQRGAARLDTTIAPYSRFVRAERDTLQARLFELESLARDMLVLRARIEQLQPVG